MKEREYQPAFIQAAFVQDEYMYLGLRNSMSHDKDPNGFPVTVFDNQGRASHFVTLSLEEDVPLLIDQLGVTEQEKSRIYTEIGAKKGLGRIYELEDRGLLLHDNAFRYDATHDSPRWATFQDIKHTVMPDMMFDRTRNNSEVQLSLALNPVFDEYFDQEASSRIPKGFENEFENALNRAAEEAVAEFGGMDFD